MGRGASIFGHLVAVGLVLLIAYFVNVYWPTVTWITDSFPSVLWVYNISVGVSVVSHLLQAAIGSILVKSVGQIAENVLSVALFATVYSVFPFVVEAGTESIVKIILVIVVIAVVIGTIAEIAKLAAAGFGARP